VITGFNTDIEHGGVVYHVQTEDKGLDSPLILSLVYSGGEILASKRSRYEDLIALGFNEEVLAQRLQRQHRLICAAINAGRIDELKRMGGRTEDEQMESPAPVAEAQDIDDAVGLETTDESRTTNEVLPGQGALPPTPLPSSAKPSAYTVHDSRRRSAVGEIEDSEEGLVLSILDEDEYRAGESFTIRILVQNRSRDDQQPLAGVTVSVKVLGTAFRPQIHSAKTQRDGIAVVSTQIPQFTSGRAAILILASAEGVSRELRRVIHPAR
jgi:hypothetical protein